MAEIIDATDRFRPRQPNGTDLVLAELAALPTTAGLASRIRAAISAGASDIFCDAYIVFWCESAQADVAENRRLHFEIADHLRGIA